MNQVKYKEKFKHKRVAFGKSAAPLYLRDDLNQLAILALESGDKTLLELFEELPTIEELKRQETDKLLKPILEKVRSKKRGDKSSS